MTGPLTFFSSSSAYRTNEELNGLRRSCAERVAVDEALGSWAQVLVDVMATTGAQWLYLQLLTVLRTAYLQIFAVNTRRTDDGRVLN
jgi:hypothetical protein